MNHPGTLPLETPRLLLRRFTLEDAAPMFHNWASDSAVTRFLVWPTHADVTETRRVLTDWTAQYKNPDQYLWAIVPKASGEPIGSIGVNSYDEKPMVAHIGYCIGQPWWGQGLTAEALSAVMTYLFDTVGMRRIDAWHDPRNPGSGAVMRKCGMRYEGTLRQADWNNQGICDACCYALLAADR